MNYNGILFGRVFIFLISNLINTYTITKQKKKLSLSREIEKKNFFFLLDEGACFLATLKNRLSAFLFQITHTPTKKTPKLDIFFSFLHWLFADSIII